MKQLCLIASVLFLLAACQSNSTAPTAVGAAPEPAKSEQPKPAPVNPEHLEWSILTVNGQAHEALATKLLRSQLGRPDSIAKGAVECGGELQTMGGANGDFWYYGKTAYEVNGGRAVLASFDVTTGKFQGRIGKLVLDQNTTLEGVRRYFPMSAKEAGVSGAGRSEEEISLPFFDQSKPSDASLNLLFREGRLQEVVFHYPC